GAEGGGGGGGGGGRGWGGGVLCGRWARKVYRGGVRKIASSVDEARPPMTTTAIGARDSAPGSSFSASGSMPKLMVAVVIKIGLSRTRAASASASVLPTPRLRRVLVKSTSRMPVLATRPTAMMRPIIEKMLSVLWVKNRPHSAPAMPSGTPRIRTIG